MAEFCLTGMFLCTQPQADALSGSVLDGGSPLNEEPS